jgi:hypothetical protein
MIRSRSGGRTSERAVREALATLAAVAPQAASPWRIDAVLRTASGVGVAMVHNEEGSAVLKAALHDLSSAQLQRQREVLVRLHADERLGAWRRFLPSLLASGRVADRVFVLEGRLPGRTPPSRQGIPDVRADLALTAIAELHERTGRRVRVDDTLLDRWVDRPVEALRRATERYWRGRRCRRALRRVAQLLRDGLSGRTLAVGWTHGDFWPGNVLFTAERIVSGIVDWGQADEEHPGAVDIAHWLITVDAGSSGRELGYRVRDRLRGGLWSVGERRRLRAAQHGGDPVGGDALLLTGWLRHVAGNLNKSPAYSSSPVWMMRNVAPVLRELAGD